MPINIRPEDSQRGANHTRDNPTGEKHAWKRQAASPTDNKPPMFLRQPARLTLAFLVESWKRLESRWEANPGFFAATVAGSVGLLLVAAMLFNAGIDWLQDDPIGEDVVIDAPDQRNADDAESDLGDSSGDEILSMRGPGKNTNVFQEDDDDPGIDSDPFEEVKTRDKSITRNIRQDVAENDSDDATEFAAPVQIAKVQASPSRQDSLDEDDIAEENIERPEPEPEQETVALPAKKTNPFEDDDEPVPDEPKAQRPWPEMRVASQPQLQSVELDDEAEVATTKTDRAAETEADSPPPEPARLKPLGKLDVAQVKDESDAAQPIENEPNDDTPSKQKRSIGLVRGPADKSVPQQDPRWQPQRTKSVAESPAPAVSARHSSPVETRIFAPAADKSTERARATQPAKPIQSVRANPVVKDDRASREKSSTPPLRLAISGPPAVGIGQRCQIEIRVTNTGSLPAHHLVVSAELPDGLVHEVAQSLEQQVETLAPGATYRALLRLRGEAVGEKTIQVEAGIGDGAPAKLSAKVRVISVSETATATSSDECCYAPLVR